MRISPIYIIGVLLCVTLLSACDTKTAYFHYNHTPIDGWEKNDTLAFNVEPLRESGRYLATVGLRVNGAFPFTKLYLIVEQTTYPSQTTNVDTVCCDITDRKGRALGKGISYYQYTFNVSDDEHASGDSIHISVRHCMKRDILPGISDIGIRLERQ